MHYTYIISVKCFKIEIEEARVDATVVTYAHDEKHLLF